MPACGLIGASYTGCDRTGTLILVCDFYINLTYWSITLYKFYNTFSTSQETYRSKVNYRLAIVQSGAAHNFSHFVKPHEKHTDEGEIKLAEIGSTCIYILSHKNNVNFHISTVLRYPTGFCYDELFKKLSNLILSIFISSLWHRDLMEPCTRVFS